MLQRLSASHPAKICYGLVNIIRRHIKLRLKNMLVPFESENILHISKDHLLGLPFGIKPGDSLYSFSYQILQSHEFSMTVVRKSVMEIPAARTICGTKDAEVIPGTVFTSRKYKSSSEQM